MRSCTLRQLAYAAIIFIVGSAPASAQLVDFSWDNDLVFGTDGTYTNGVKLGWRGDEHRASACRQCWSTIASNIFSFLPATSGASTEHSLGMDVRQTMITPEDITITTPQYDDLPYVGVLRGDFSLFSRSKNSATSYNLSLGVIGPNSGAESAQKRIHKLTDSTPPQGWEYQLGEDTLFGLGAARADRHALWTHAEGRQTEWGTAYGGQLNNFESYAAAGSFFRYGYNLPSNLLPDYAGIGSSVSLPGLLANKNYGWSIYAGLAAQAIAYSYIEDKSEGYSHEQDHFIGSVTLGGEMHTPNFHISLSLKQTSSQAQNARRPLHFGTLALIWAL
jgi:hypothetical protein